MKPEKYTKEQIKNALIERNGFISQAAKLLQCEQTTVRNYITRYPELNDVLKDAREEMLDVAEKKLTENIMNNDNTAIIFFLKTQGKTRGYQEKSDVEKETQNKITIVFDENE